MAAKSASKVITVRALKAGFDGNQRREQGDVFAIPNEEAFSDRWMERVPEKDLKETREKMEAFEEKFSNDPTLGPDVQRSALDKMQDDFKTDSSDKDIAERAKEADMKARQEDEKDVKAAQGKQADDEKSKAKKH